MATGTAQESQNCVTLKGSVELIVDFFIIFGKIFKSRKNQPDSLKNAKKIFFKGTIFNLV